MRPCPKCHGSLRETTMQRQQVDRCPTCRGLFLDAGELESVVEMVRLFETVPLDEQDIDTVPQAEWDREVLCPADGHPMDPQEIGGTIVDRCPSCGGIWLDGGEIAALKLAENTLRENLNLYVRLGQ